MRNVCSRVDFKSGNHLQLPQPPSQGNILTTKRPLQCKCKIKAQTGLKERILTNCRRGLKNGRVFRQIIPSQIHFLWRLSESGNGPDLGEQLCMEKLSSPALHYHTGALRHRESKREQKEGIFDESFRFCSCLQGEENLCNAGYIDTED